MFDSLDQLETLFSVCGAMAMLGWAGLALLPGQKLVVEVIARLVIPALIGLVYIAVMATHMGDSPEGGGFGSLAEVKALFTVDALILGGWVHYLCFDLFVGSWEVSNARDNGVPHLLVLPCLALTLMAGPAGLVLYLLIRGLVHAKGFQTHPQG